MVSQKNIMNQEYTKYTYLYSRISDRSKAQMIFLKPKGVYVIGYHRGNVESSYQIYEKILAFIEQNNLKVAGPSYEDLLLDEVSLEGYENYITEIAIHVESV